MIARGCNDVEGLFEIIQLSKYLDARDKEAYKKHITQYFPKYFEINPHERERTEKEADPFWILTS